MLVPGLEKPVLLGRLARLVVRDLLRLGALHRRPVLRVGRFEAIRPRLVLRQGRRPDVSQVRRLL